MRILITGNMGYVGPVVVRHLRRRFPEAELIGFDAGFFGHCLTTTGPLPETLLDRQIFGDVRAIQPADLAGVDAVVHLAAISNDPMGNQFAAATDDINRGASLRLAGMAADAGVRSFVFASSCSVYGYAEQGARTESDAVNPLTAYARSKIETEAGLRALDNRGMTISCLRFATACGMSDRLRLDLVLNDFVAGALASDHISILSDGTPWRPLIDVSDMARAVEWAVGRDPAAGGKVLTVNVGSDAWNRRVSELAESVAAQLPGTVVSTNKAAPPDKRSYKVDFGLFASLAPAHQPICTLDESIGRLRAGLSALGFADGRFREGRFMRLKVLTGLVAEGALDAGLRRTGA